VKETLLIAVGGNSLLRAGEKGTIPEQFANARLLAARVAEIASRDYGIVLTHGNGPQVGSQLLRSEIASNQTYALPLDVCVSMSQGEIGYALQNSLQSVFRERGLTTPVVTLITQVLIERTDEGFLNPTKPVGPFYSREVAERKQRDLGWEMVEDAARGYRRVVPSPKPVRVLELDAIRTCLELGAIVIAAGGGGIPVVNEDGNFRGVEAVIDKDRVSALLAKELKLRRLIITTDVEYVYLNYKKPSQEAIKRLSVPAAQRYLSEGHFAQGSMRPKIEAAIDFLESGGEEVIITSAENLLAALEGNAGTHIRK
jgi:carbamate kinase